MKKEGAIILGIGGDNSNGSAGTFYEGVMTSGYPSDATENAVQANITAAGYSLSGGSRQERRDRAVASPAGAWTCRTAATTNGTQVQLWDCNGRHQPALDRTPPASS